MAKDILTQLGDGLIHLIGNIDDPHIAFWARLALLLLFPTLLCVLSYVQGNRSVPIQWCWCAIGIIIAFLVPVNEWLPLRAGVRFILIVFSAMAVWFLPRRLALYLVPENGPQARFASALYLAIGLLIFLELCLRGGSK